jgi:autotransporter-associated beta strand protein
LPNAVVLFALTGWLFSKPYAMAQLGSGNLLVERVGDGTATLTNAATSLFVDQFSTAGTSIGSIAMPAATTLPTGNPFNLMDSGTATSNGYLSRSVNGRIVQLSGYNATPGTAGIANSMATSNARVVAVINGAGSVDTSRAFTMLSGSNYRRVVSIDGSDFWAAGQGGIVYTGTASSGTGTSLLTGNTRSVGLTNGSLFASTASSSFNGAGSSLGIYQIGTAIAPTSAPAASEIVNIINTGTGSSPYGFQFNSSMTIAYVADDRATASGGIQKWISDGSGTWTLAYTLGTGAANVGARSLAVDWSNPSEPKIYATTSEASNAPNRLIAITDTGASSAAMTLATAASNTVLRGVDMALLPAVWTSSSAGNWSSTAMTTYNSTIGAVTTPSKDWSTNLADGTNLEFQRVNAASLTLNNNSTLATAASIGFSGQGFGSSDTAYTLTGNALTLDGTDAIGSGVTGSGITNNSSATQTINIPLTLGANQTFAANGGNLVLGGASLNLGAAASGYTLTVSGARNTSVSANIANGGSVAGNLIKNGSGSLTLSGANSYTGTTTVNQGKLIVNGSHNNGGAYTIAAGATLAGTGLLADSDVAIQANAILSPGSELGTLRVGQSLSMDGIYDWQIASPLLADLVTVGGNLAITGKLSLSFLANIDLEKFDKFTLFAYQGSLSGNFGNVLNGWQINYNDKLPGVNLAPAGSWKYVTLTATDRRMLLSQGGSRTDRLSAVPEPSGLFLGCVSMLWLAGRRPNRKFR